MCWSLGKLPSSKFQAPSSKGRHGRSSTDEEDRGFARARTLFTDLIIEENCHVEACHYRRAVARLWNPDRHELADVVRAAGRGSARRASDADERAVVAGGSSAATVNPDKLDHHDGRAVALDQLVVGGPEAELAAGAVLLQRSARTHSAARP